MGVAHMFAHLCMRLLRALSSASARRRIMSWLGPSSGTSAASLRAKGHTRAETTTHGNESANALTAGRQRPNNRELRAVSRLAALDGALHTGSVSPCAQAAVLAALHACVAVSAVQRTCGVQRLPAGPTACPLQVPAQAQSPAQT